MIRKSFWHLRRWVLLASCSIHSLAWSNIGNRVSSSKIEGEKDRIGSMGLRSVHYLNQNFKTPQSRDSEFFQARILREAKEGDFSLGLDLEGQFSPNQSWYNTVTANEFYFRMDPEWSNATLFMGRKRSHWSLLDEKERLALWQPVYKVDPLNPRIQGLTGLFVQFKNENWTYEFFGTPIFLPDHGPQAEVRNGEFVRTHPWVQTPPEQIFFNGEKVAPYYEINKPSIPEVMSNQGFGFNTQWESSPEKGWRLGMAWASKPMNQMLLGFDGTFQFAGDQNLKLTILPKVGFHEIATLEAEYRSDHWSSYFSAMEDTPKNNQFDLPWTYQSFNPAQFLSAGVDFHQGPWELGLSYIHREGGESVTHGPRSSVKVLPERYLFRDLSGVKVHWKSKIKPRWAYELSGEWRHELKEGSDLITAKGSLLVGALWTAYIGVDLLGSDNKVKDEVDFIETYQANDRAFGGLEYAF